MDTAGFLALVIGLPILGLILLICLCCWCCHCCCCARNQQQVVVLPQSNPTSTVVNTTLVTPYSQGYSQPQPAPGYANQFYPAQQQPHQLPLAPGHPNGATTSLEQMKPPPYTAMQQ